MCNFAKYTLLITHTIKSHVMRFISLLLMLTVYAAAFPKEISGIVTDSQGTPVPGATCTVHMLPDSVYFKGGITDDAGIFTVKVPDDRKWALTVSYVGYVRQTIDSKNYDKQTRDGSRFTVKLASLQLGEVVVKARVPQVKMKGEALSYNVDEILKTYTLTSAHDLLKKTPMIQSLNGDNIDLAGAPLGSVIYINGRKSMLSASQLLDYLKSIPADQVKNVEIIYNPPARWKTRQAVINVVLRRQAAYTANGQVKGDLFDTHIGSLATGGSLFVGMPKLNLNVMYNFSNVGNKAKSIQYARHTVGDETREIHDTTTARGRSQNHTVYTALSYEFNKKSNLEFTYTGSFTPTSRQWGHQANSYLGKSVSANNGESRLNAMSLVYNSPIGLSGGVEYTNNNYSSNGMINTTAADGTESPFMKSLSTQRANRVKVYLDGLHTLRGWTLSYGASYRTTHTNSLQNNSSSFLEGESRSSSDEREIKFYAGIQRSFFNNRLFTSLSASGERYKLADYSHNGIYPKATVTYMPSNTHIFQASYQTFKNYPTFWDRMDYISFSNEYQVNLGNPNLRPADYKTANLIYVFRNKYVLSAVYYRVKDFFFSQIYLSPDEFLQVNQMFNADKSDLWSVSLTIPFSIKKVWHANVTLSESLERFSTADWHGLSFDRRRWRGAISMNNTIIVNTDPKISLEVGGHAVTRNIVGLWERPGGAWALNAGATIALLKNQLVIAVRGNDLFETRTPMQYMNFHGQHLSLDDRFYGRTLNLSVVYKLKGFKEKTFKGVDTSQFMSR